MMTKSRKIEKPTRVAVGRQDGCPLTSRGREIIRESAKEQYKLWYQLNVKANLTDEQKMTLAQRISDLTLEEPIWLDHVTNHIEKFPELEPYSNSKKITGLQLCAVFEAIIDERRAKS